MSEHHNIPDLPHNDEAEAAVLGSLMLENQEIRKLTLQPIHFFRESHREIFRAMLWLDGEGEPLDTVTLSKRLKEVGKLKAAGGGARLVELSTETPAGTAVEHYAKIVLKYATLRSLIEFAGKVSEQAHGHPEDLGRLVETSQQRLAEIGLFATTQSYADMRTTMREVVEHLASVLDGKPNQRVTPTGFHDLDRKLNGGFRSGHFIVIAGRPSMGKTALALNVAYLAMTKRQMAIGIFSMEMPLLEIGLRILMLDAGKSLDELLDREKLARCWADGERNVCSRIEMLGFRRFYIDDQPALDIDELKARARKMHQDQGLDMLIVDYMQLMKGTLRSSRRGREAEVSEISRGLKHLARELSVPVVGVAQLNREVERRADKRPLMSDLRESGAIEQDADVIMLLFRPEYYAREDSEELKRLATDGKLGLVEVCVGKQRNGPTGTVQLRFCGPQMKFSDPAADDGTPL
jgi:replicative DNA helicase